MHYDESTSLNIVVQQPSRVWKGIGDGTTTEFSFNGLNVKIIDKVTVGGIRVYGFTATKGSGGMYESISFDAPPAAGSQIRVMYSIGSGVSYNTWSSFGLVPKELPVWGAATPKSNFTQIDGSSVYYDFTDFNNDVPGYKMISDKFQFAYYRDLEPAWNFRNEVTKVTNSLSGKDTLISFADQPNWQRRARLAVEVKPAKDYSEVSIKYEADPYEYYKWSSSEDVPWDEFSFEDDPILQWNNDAMRDGFTYVKSNGTWTWSSGWFTWNGPPTLITFEHPIGKGAWAYVSWRANIIEADEGDTTSGYNTAWDYHSGTKGLTDSYQNSALILRPGQNWITFSVSAVDSDTTQYNGTASITVREARL